MATYAELNDILQDSDLRNKIRIAVIVAADTINSESDVTANHANRVIWAKQAFQNPQGKAEEMLSAVIAQNNATSIANITGASDAAIQTNVDAVVDTFADGTA